MKGRFEDIFDDRFGEILSKRLGENLGEKTNYATRMIQSAAVYVNK
jgi:hypothetical protein